MYVIVERSKAQSKNFCAHLLSLRLMNLELKVFEQLNKTQKKKKIFIRCLIVARFPKPYGELIKKALFFTFFPFMGCHKKNTPFQGVRGQILTKETRQDSPGTSVQRSEEFHSGTGRDSSPIPGSRDFSGRD